MARAIPYRSSLHIKSLRRFVRGIFLYVAFEALKQGPQQWPIVVDGGIAHLGDIAHLASFVA